MQRRVQQLVRVPVVRAGASHDLPASPAQRRCTSCFTSGNQFALNQCMALFQSNAQAHFPRTKGLQEQKAFILKMHDRKFVQHNMHTDRQGC